MTSDDRSMRLKDRPEFAGKPRPLTYPPETTVLDAARGMAERDYGSAMVVDAEERVIGVVTERDILKRVVSAARDPATTPLSAIMTENPRMAREDDDVLDWLRIMSNERFRRLPVVDSDGRIKVVFTQGDFVSYTWPDLMYQARQYARAKASANFPLLLIGGGIALYTLLMLIVLRTVG